MRAGWRFHFLSPPTYTATSTLMLETQRGLLQESLLGTQATTDSAWIESQIGVLKSQNVAAYLH